MKARGLFNEGVLLTASHNGYARHFGLIHRRSILMSEDGTRIDGEYADGLPQNARLKANSREASPWPSLVKPASIWNEEGNRTRAAILQPCGPHAWDKAQLVRNIMQFLERVKGIEPS